MKSAKAQILRLHTGVPGLDEVLGGGLPEFSFNVIAGPPGSGKTTLAHQIMFAMATPERPALYVSVLAEPPLKILRYQQQFDFFDLDQLNRSIRLINLADEAASGDLKKVLARMSAEVEQHQPGLVFIDSFSSIVLGRTLEGQHVLSMQHLLQQLSVLLISWQATTFLIGEYFHDGEPDPIFTAADGLIWLRQNHQGNSMVRKMEVVKMRGQATVPGLHTFRMGQAGIQVFAPAAQSPPPAMKPATPGSDRLSMGVDGLDEMMGGGLPQGYSLLVAGPSGSGKSILASAFLIEGARQGEKGVIAAFEQRSHNSRGPAIAALIDSGQLGVVDTRIVGLSVDEMAMLLVAEIRRLDARRVVLDSLSGFELALAPTFRDDFRESLSRLVGALAATGVTVLMTSELEDRYTDLRFSPYGTAFLTDAIIVQRYVEIDSRLERMLAVVKVRSSPHSDALRRFRIDGQGIHLDAPMIEFEGLLGGRPRRARTKALPSP
jgi:circadian clock protein KaiC